MKMQKFTEEEIQRMKDIINDDKKRPPVGDFLSSGTNKEHLVHCFNKMIYLAEQDFEQIERAVQFGLNLGRAQEILLSIGGVKMWWQAYTPLISKKDYYGIITLTQSYMKILGLAE